MKWKNWISDLLFVTGAHRWGKPFIGLSLISMSVFAAYHKATVKVTPIEQEVTAQAERNSDISNREPASIPYPVEPGIEVSLDSEPTAKPLKLGAKTLPPQKTPKTNGEEKAARAYDSNLYNSVPNLSASRGKVNSDRGSLSSTADKNTSVTVEGTQTAVGGGSGNVVQGGANDTPLASAPTVTSVTPTSGPGPGGTLLTVYGTNFAPGSTVNLSGSICGSVTVVSSSQITCHTTLHAATNVDVIVVNSSGTNGKLIGGFTYMAVGPVQSAMWVAGAKTGSYGSTAASSVTGEPILLKAP